MYEPYFVTTVGYLILTAVLFSALWCRLSGILWSALLYSVLHVVFDLSSVSYGTKFKMALDHQSYSALATILLLSGFAFVKGRWIGDFFRVISVGNLLFTLIRMKWPSVEAHPGAIHGLAINPSINIAIGAVTAPFLPLKLRAVVQSGYMILAVLASSTTGILAIIASLIPGLPWALCVSLVPVVMLAGQYALPDWYGMRRFEEYRFFFQTWRDNFSPWWGAGTNQFLVWGPYFQSKTNPPEIWAALHSDWFQVLFEQGIVGLVLWAAVAINLLRRSWRRDPVIASSSLAWIVTAAFYFPAQTSSMSIIAAAILNRSLLVHPCPFYFQGHADQQLSGWLPSCLKAFFGKLRRAFCSS